MAKSDLNVSLGVLTDKFNRGIRRAERTLRKFERQANQIGSSITQNFSVPLGLAGAGAIAAAADVEKLTLALSAVTKETGPLNSQLDRLRKIAESPALGFEQAVAASTRLQAVNLSAQEAERTIAAFGNAVARSGGGAEDFDGTIRALTQIASKGKVFAEEINQINERVFEIRPAMEAAFGTSVAKDIEDLGITAEEFIAKVTTEFEKLEKVDGGLANSLENARISIKLFAADVGNLINETFDVQDALDNFSAGLRNVSTFMQRLSPESKRLILQFAGIAAATGPAILALATTARIMRSFAPAAKLAVTGFKVLAAEFIRIRDFSKALPTTLGGLRKGTITLGDGFGRLAPRISKAVKAFRALNLVTKVSIIGGAVVAITALVAAFQALQRRIERANAVNRLFNDLNAEAAQNIAAEKSQVDRLITAARDETRSKEDRITALRRLEQIAPAYFKNLSLEQSALKNLTQSQKAFNEELLRQAKIKAAEEQLISMQKQLFDIQSAVTEAKPTFFQTLGNAALSLGNSTAFASRQIASNTKNLINNQSALKEQEKALLEFLDANQDVSDIGNSTVTTDFQPNNRDTEGGIRFDKKGFVADAQEAFSKTAQSLNVLGSSIFNTLSTQANSVSQIGQAATITGGQVLSIGKKINENLKAGQALQSTAFLQDYAARINLASQQAQVFADGPGRLLAERINITSNALVRSVELFGLQGSATQQLQEKLSGLQIEFEVFNKNLNTTQRFAELITPAFDSFFTTIAEGGKDAFGAFGEAIKGLVRQLVVAVAKAAALAAVLTTFGAITGIPIGQINTALGGAQGGSLFGSILKNFTGFARGGLVTGPTAAIVGEAGPEVISRLDDPVNPFANMELSTRIKGEDLLITLERAQFRQNRRI